jgi:hypothetical protein
MDVYTAEVPKQRGVVESESVMPSRHEHIE